MGAEKLSFRLLYSEGMSHFAYKDIESIVTKYNYHISYNRIDIEGKIVGIEDAQYIKVEDADNKLRTVKISKIDNFIMSVTDDNSFENKVRNKFPYTKGDINVGLSLESSNLNERTVDFMVNLTHKQAEHEIKLFIDYEYETRENQSTPKYVSTDELVATIGYKNYFKPDVFWYVATSGDYDRTRQIKNRYTGSFGYGRKYTFSKSAWIEPYAGLAYVDTDYTEDSKYEDDKFVAAAIALNLHYTITDIALINTLIMDGQVMYYPSIKDFDEDWLLRSNVNFTVPLFDFLSLKLAWSLVNDSNPNPSVGNNKTTTKLLFGVNF